MMVFPGSLSWLKHRLGLRNKARQRQRNPLPRFVPRLLPLEDRCLLSADPMVPAGSTTALNQIFWNGGAATFGTGPAGFISGIVDAPTERTITITNTTDQTIYPILREANTGKDPNNKNNGPNGNNPN